MKKLLLIAVVPFIINFVLTAQITRTEADMMVLDYLGQQPYILFRKDRLQTEMSITTIVMSLCYIVYMDK